MIIEQIRDGSMQETAEAIAQLATATASDRGTVATLTTTNAKLATQIEPARTTNNDSYCWPHGFQVAKSHTSATCNVRKTGHQENATRIDTMGGVQWGKE
jgi:hypothetical protein